MTTLILVSIGILLAGASALMIVWYGGDAFDRSRISADAARLLVEGAQIEKAESLYRSHEGRSPLAVDAADPMRPLIARRYMVKSPLGDAGPWVMDYANGMIRADIGSADDARALDVCRSARRSQNLPSPRQVYRCDGSDYPYAHPPGTLPAAEPCCSWAGSAPISGGSGEVPTGPGLDQGPLL